MQKPHSRIIRSVPSPSTHTMNRPLRVPGQLVKTVGEAYTAADRIGRGGQVLPREQVAEAPPFEIDVTRFEPPPAPPEPEYTDDEAERLVAEKQAEAAHTAELEAARDAGYRAGYEAARAELERDFREKAALCIADAKQMHAENERFLERAEVLLVDLAFRIAETVVDSPLLATARDAARDAVSTAVERLAGAHTLRVRVHPVDYLRFQEAGLVDQLSSLYGDLRWEPDASMAQGDWSVESPDAVIRRIERELLADLRERLGLLTGTQPELEEDEE